MTKAQIRKLETILGKLEALQNEVESPAIRGRLGDGKKELLRALSESDH
jgi:ABC-type transport system involved in cytochrome c biogenesis ATPase subunit